MGEREREREGERERGRDVGLRFVNVKQLLREESGGWRRTDGGRGALRINALFHFQVREIRYQRHIFTLSETDGKQPFCLWKKKSA